MSSRSIVFELEHGKSSIHFELPYVGDVLESIHDFYLIFEFNSNINQSFVQTINSIKQFTFQIEQFSQILSLSGEQLLQLYELNHEEYEKYEKIWNHKHELVVPLYHFMFSGDISVIYIHSFKLNWTLKNTIQVKKLLFVTSVAPYIKSKITASDPYLLSYRVVDEMISNKDTYDLKFVGHPFAIIMKKPDDLKNKLGKSVYLLNGTASYLKNKTYLNSQYHFCFLTQQEDQQTLKFRIREQKAEKSRVQFIVCCKEKSNFSVV